MPAFGPTGGTGPVRLDTFSTGAVMLAYDEDLQLQFFIDHIRTAMPADIRTFVQNQITDTAAMQTLLTMLTLLAARSILRTRSNNQ